MTFTVKDLFKRPYFENATVIAGKNGLDREVKWVHIVEIARFGHLLNGNEVILTTGIGWAHDEQKSLSYLQQLLDYNASALCIELAVHVEKLPEKMLKVADEHNFPIIAFHEEVRFIDITKDLHESLIGLHEDIWWNLEHFHQKLQEALTSNSTVGDFLKIIHQETKKQIVFHYQDQYRFFPSPTKKLQMGWIHALKNEDDFYHQHVMLLNEPIGTLYYLEDKQTINQFEQLALKRLSDILTQYFWRSHKQSEVEQMGRNKWILDAIYGKMSHLEVMKKIREEHPRIPLREAIIGIKPYQTSLLVRDREINSETTSIMLLRTVLVDFGFQLYTVKDNARNVYVLLLLCQFSDNILTRLEQALQKLKSSDNHLPFQNDLQWLSFGKVVQDFSQLSKSYETAMSTLAYQQKIQKLAKPFYNHLTIYRLIDQMSNEQELQELVMEYIGPIIEFDKKNKSELRKTLQVYLENLGSKNETAKELHIVRQTLYHRLQRIEELLGSDYLEPKKRLMLEFSLHAYDFLQHR